MTFSSYMEANILVDLALICVLSIVVLPRSPRLYLAILFLNLCQYAFVIPLDPATGTARLVWSEETEATSPEKKIYQDRARLGREQESHPAQNPLQLMGRARDAFSAVAGAMGERSSLPDGEDLQKQFREEMGLEDSEDTNSRPVSLSPQQILTDALRDPEAMWLAMRGFWLAACFMLFIQRPRMGAAAACANLIPVPFLARAIPYLKYQYENTQEIHDVEAQLRDPETLAEYFGAFWSSHGFIVLILSSLILVVMVISVWRRGVQRARDTGQLRSQLDPEEFQIELNGALHDFRIEEQNLLVGDLRFPLDQVAAVRGKPGSWNFGGRTTVRFVSKYESIRAASPSQVIYSYKKK